MGSSSTESTETSVLHEFWTVTQTSLYRVSDERDDYGTPVVEKIGKGEESDIDTGEQLGMDNAGGSNVGITGYKGIVLYDSENGMPAEGINRLYHGAHTSLIVALFLRLEDALFCFSNSDRIPLDPIWRKNTEEVLAAIGEDHPVFVVSKGAEWGLSYE